MAQPRPRRYRTVLVVLAMCAALLAIVIGQRLIATNAFDSLEANTVSGDANRVAVALTYETKLLRNFGSTNSIWDSSYDDVRKADRATFASDFAPADMHSMYGVDGVFGVDATGQVRTGGLVRGSVYVPPPSDLGSTQLAQMVDVRAKAGASRCGLVVTSASPYLYCGFSARRSDSGGQPGYGLIYLSSLDAPSVAALAKTTGMALRVVDSAPPSGDQQVRLSTPLGAMHGSTRVIGANTVELSMSLPALGGKHLVLQSRHARPIHATDGRTAAETFLLMGVCMLVLLGLIVQLVRWTVRDRVAPLRATTEEIIGSGDREVRLDASGRGEIAALGRAINQLLDSVSEQAAEVERGQREREQRIIDAHRLQKRTEEQAREQAQSLVDATVEAVTAELTTVLDQATRLRQAADDIGSRTIGADAVTREVLDEAAAADLALAELNTTLGQVDGIVATIKTITDQTRILALNASIEAERAGEFGSGFRVVADEVRSLSADTAASAAKIAATTGLVSTGARNVARTLDGVTTRVAQVTDATQQVRAVVGDQSAVVDALTDVVRQSLDRVRSMARPTDDSERRVAERLPVFGQGTLTSATGEHRVSIRDLSSTGLAIAVPAGTALSKGGRVRLALPPQLEGLVLDADVAWTRDSGDALLAGLHATSNVAGLEALAQQIRDRYTR